MGEETNKYIIISIIFFVLFLGTLISGCSSVNENGVSGKVESADSQDEVIRLKAKLAELEESKKELEEEKLALEGKLKEGEAEDQQKDRFIFGVDKDSPFDHVKDSEVRVLKHKVEIDMKNVMWWKIADTNSMDPLIDIGTTALSVKPISEESIHVGDVAFYNSEIAKREIVHRVVKIDSDEQGWYSKFRGDNLEKDDPEDVRYNQVIGVLIGIIY